jgi:hypothetical protein
LQPLKQNTKAAWLLPFEEQMAWILKASDEQLNEYIHLSINDLKLHNLARAERERRHFSRVTEPHWTVVPAYWLLWATLSATFIFGIISVIAWRRPVDPAKRDAPAVQPSNSVPAISPYIGTPATQQAIPPPAQAIAPKTPVPPIYEPISTNLPPN